MPNVTLQDIRDATERRFGDYSVTLEDGAVVSLLSPLRLSDDDSKKLQALQKSLDKSATEPWKVRALMADLLRMVAKSSADADLLLARVGDDLPTLIVLIEEWGKSAQVGEASPSPS